MGLEKTENEDLRGSPSKKKPMVDTGFLTSPFSPPSTPFKPPDQPQRIRSFDDEKETSLFAKCQHLIFLSCMLLFFLVQTQTFQLIKYYWHPGYFSPYNRANPNHNWCPTATCNNSPQCQPCRQRFLIVIATGRSGSTTLTNMLDMLPNIRMAGENNGHLLFARDAMQSLHDSYDLNLESLDGVVGAWKHNPIPIQSTACPIQAMFESINPPTQDELIRLAKSEDTQKEKEETIIGFKTVRFHGPDFIDEFTKDLIPSADFLMETFPCARFIINIRGDVEKQVESWKNSFGLDLDGDEIRQYNKWLINVAAHLGQDRARLLDMSEWSKRDNSGVEVLNDLIEWLGFEDCKYDSLLHSNKNGYGIDRQRMFLGENCRYKGN